MVSQFTIKTANSKKAIYFLSLMSYSINKLKFHIFCVILFIVEKKTFLPENGLKMSLGLLEYFDLLLSVYNSDIV